MVSKRLFEAGIMPFSKRERSGAGIDHYPHNYFGTIFDDQSELDEICEEVMLM
jgi:hypothetical protein